MEREVGIGESRRWDEMVMLCAWVILGAIEVWIAYRACATTML